MTAVLSCNYFLTHADNHFLCGYIWRPSKCFEDLQQMGTDKNSVRIPVMSVCVYDRNHAGCSKNNALVKKRVSIELHTLNEHAVTLSGLRSDLIKCTQKTDDTKCSRLSFHRLRLIRI